MFCVKEENTCFTLRIFSRAIFKLNAVFKKNIHEYSFEDLTSSLKIFSGIFKISSSNAVFFLTKFRRKVLTEVTVQTDFNLFGVGRIY
jgi:hypothetical protein